MLTADDDLVGFAAAKLWAKFAICGVIGVAPLVISWWPVAGAIGLSGLAAIAAAFAAARNALILRRLRILRSESPAPESCTQVEFGPTHGDQVD